MLDALVIYYFIADMRHAGYFRVVVDFIRRAKAQCGLMPWAILRNRRNAAAAATTGVATASGAGTHRRASAPAQFRADTTFKFATQPEWMEALVRLENYVTSMS
jgi:hypothetical protein